MRDGQLPYRALSAPTATLSVHPGVRMRMSGTAQAEKDYVKHVASGDSVLCVCLCVCAPMQVLSWSGVGGFHMMPITAKGKKATIDALKPEGVLHAAAVREQTAA